jgi:hypothetical protein
MEILRSALSIFSGLVTVMALVMLSVVAGTKLFGVSQGQVSQAPAAYLIFNITTSLLAAVLGGYVTALVATRTPLIHALVLAGLFLLMALPGLIGGAQPGQPKWYPAVMAVGMVLAIFLGGWIRGR